MTQHMVLMRNTPTWNGTIKSYMCYHSNGTTQVKLTQVKNLVKVHIGMDDSIPVIELYNHGVGKGVGKVLVELANTDTTCISINVSAVVDVENYEKWLGMVRRNILKTTTQAILYKYTFNGYYKYEILIHH